MEVFIKLRQLQFHAPIGWYAEERLLGSDIMIDIELKSEIKKAGADELSHTVNYETVYEVIKKIVLTPTKLLETVSNKIVDEILSVYKEVTEVKVTVTKLHPPLGGIIESSSVEIRKRRN